MADDGKSGTGNDDKGDGGKGTGSGDQQQSSEKTFTQADVDRLIKERLGRERDETRRKFGDYDQLKQQVEASKSADDKIADLQTQLAATQRESLRARVQARYGISDEDAELYLTGTDQETLEKQAQGLKAKADERNQGGGFAPREGRNGRPTVSDDKQAVRTLFGRP